MKILHVFKTWYPDSLGGIERIMMELCNGSAKTHGIQNKVLTTKAGSKKVFKENPDLEIIRIRRIVNNKSTPIPALWAFKKEYLKLISIADVVHYHFPWPIADIYDLIYNYRPKVPIVITYQSDIVRQRRLLFFYKHILNKFLTKADAIVATSQNYLSSSDVLQRHAGKVRVIANGLPDIAVNDSLLREKNKYKNKYGKSYFLFVGAPRYYKGLYVLLQSCVNAPFKVVVAGDGDGIHDIKRFAKILRLDNIHFLGSISEFQKHAAILGCRALVLPSIQRSEAYGLALVEAAIMAKPMISTNLGTGTSWINMNEKTGLVVKPNCPSSLKNAMLKLYTDEVMARKYGVNARYRYETYFSSDIMIENYVDLYKEVSEIK